MSFVQGGAGLHWFSASVYNYLTGVKVADIIVDISEVPDYEVKEMLNKVRVFVKLPQSLSRADLGCL